jgi:DNA-binding Lrp family transcriptional regulator
MTRIISTEQVLELFQTYRMTSADLAERVGITERGAMYHIKELREKKLLVIAAYEYAEDTKSHPIYRIRKSSTDRDKLQRSRAELTSEQRAERTLEKRLLKLIEDYYIRYHECQTESLKKSVVIKYEVAKSEMRKEFKQRRSVRNQRSTARKSVSRLVSSLMVERQPALAMCWMNPVSQ